MVYDQEIHGAKNKVFDVTTFVIREEKFVFIIFFVVKVWKFHFTPYFTLILHYIPFFLI
jgi:hypothetical protein